MAAREEGYGDYLGSHLETEQLVLVGGNFGLFCLIFF